MPAAYMCFVLVPRFKLVPRWFWSDTYPDIRVLECTTVKHRYHCKQQTYLEVRRRVQVCNHLFCWNYEFVAISISFIDVFTMNISCIDDFSLHLLHISTAYKSCGCRRTSPSPHSHTPRPTSTSDENSPRRHSGNFLAAHIAMNSHHSCIQHMSMRIEVGMLAFSPRL